MNKTGIYRTGKSGMIFGKFYPLHVGHVDFIQQASGYVDRLYVVVCTDEERDIKLFNESAMKRMPTVKDRINFVMQAFKGQPDIKVLHLSEDGIPAYPTGWAGWSGRVKELLEENNIKIDVIFTNEPQDVKNYKDNFVDLTGTADVFNDELEIVTIDTSRSNFSISATEIRKNPYKNWEFIPKHVREFFTLKIAVTGSEKSGKSVLANKLANHYNTTYVGEYRKEYLKEVLQGKEENLQYHDYSNIAYGHNERIGKALKNAHRLIVVDTEFAFLQAHYMESEGKKHPVVDSFMENIDFDILIYIRSFDENIEKKACRTFDRNLESLMKGYKGKIVKLEYRYEESPARKYMKSIEEIDDYIFTFDRNFPT